MAKSSVLLQGVNVQDPAFRNQDRVAHENVQLLKTIPERGEIRVRQKETKKSKRDIVCL